LADVVEQLGLEPGNPGVLGTVVGAGGRKPFGQSQKVLAYALAYLSFRRGEHTPAWTASLEPGPRAAFDKSMAHFHNRRV